MKAMTRTLVPLVLLALAACTVVPAAPPAQQAQSACANGGESTQACQVERYNSIGSK
jgi:outer membrane biogenesis lipoprotein LolB